MTAKQHPRSHSIRASLVVGLIATTALVAGCSSPTVSPPAPPVSNPPVASPSAPAESPAVVETYVELETTAAAPSRAMIRDASESLASASSGHPADGVSVGWDEVRVESIDDDSLRLTWADYPAPNEYAVLVSMGDDGRFGIRIIRPDPTETSDAIALDRVLVLDFHVAVPLSDVQATIQPSLDTAS